jgi:hypothetical protein
VLFTDVLVGCIVYKLDTVTIKHFCVTVVVDHHHDEYLNYVLTLTLLFPPVFSPSLYNF